MQSKSLRERELVEAMKRRILREIEKQDSAAPASIVQHLYNGGGAASSPEHSQGISEQALANPELYDYMVDIERKNTPEGWTKQVKRYATPKTPAYMDDGSHGTSSKKKVK